MMAVLHFSLGSVNMRLPTSLRQIPIKSMQHLLVVLKYKGASVMVF